MVVGVLTPDVVGFVEETDSVEEGFAHQVGRGVLEGW